MQTKPSSAITPTKSVFQSKTFWGAILTAIAAISPVVAENIEEYQTTGKIDPNSVSQVVVVLATTGLTILGRIDATEPLYTPNGMPGANKPKAE
ncbi:hypothetical protein [Myxacorys almedinensis]|uniref:Uncharacterized protein n=1 Tax=Myxacorys almedinensis A TaxID=2690445 RepID=A0A8J7ZBK4_9CYAN|nr:hypothetical protein [Myxacorys almedinensis]NDJ19933.1 hypothetical protein [Myxacorys almedinensis A]